MALTQIDFDEKEEIIISKVCETEKLNKPKAIKKIVREYNN